jgi:hypothetical protein
LWQWRSNEENPTPKGKNFFKYPKQKIMERQQQNAANCITENIDLKPLIPPEKGSLFELTEILQRSTRASQILPILISQAAKSEERMAIATTIFGQLHSVSEFIRECRNSQQLCGISRDSYHRSSS